MWFVVGFIPGATTWSLERSPALIENPDTPLRVPVGEDAHMILGTCQRLDDAAFEAAMRRVVGLT